ncbi:hypothetical protein F4859DRAFT_514677 [Xylaria cf. heliscus]|nr:hypothetical protein F4859DRAFT_514677 [Xylaria cf. heliscus]
MPPKSRHVRSIIWDESMKLPPGGPHPREFAARLRFASRIVGNGTIENPKIVWVNDRNFLEYPDTEENFLAIEAIVREQTRKFGLSYVWIAKESHGTSIVGVTQEGEPVKTDDDNHITLRMGISKHVFNLHGHFYLVYEGDSVKNRALRMMKEHERGVVGGTNPQLWAWGTYPPGYGRSMVKFPKIPFEIKPGSILDKQMQKNHEENERKKAIKSKTRGMT